MRAGKRNDIFPNSYTGDPLSGYRRVVRTAGWPSWNMLYMDSGPTPVGYVEPATVSDAGPKDPEDEEKEAHPVEEPADEETDDDEETPDEELSASPSRSRVTRRGARHHR